MSIGMIGKQMRAVVDIEADSLNPTKVHCVVAKDVDTGKVYPFPPDLLHGFRDWSLGVKQFIMHNGISFDAPVLNRLLGTNIKPHQIVDTLILSQLLNPMRDNGHSLEAWGNKLAMPKGDVDTFEVYTPDMLEYCKQDVNITHKLFEVLQKEGRGFSKSSVYLEHQVRLIIDQQEKNGFYLDMQKAMSLYNKLRDEANELEKWAVTNFDPTVVELKTKTKYIPFNIGSRQQIAERLMELGWKPKQHTDKGNIIINEAVLDTIELPEAKKFSRFFLLQKRIAQIKSWIEACDDTDGRVHGRVMTLKTITGRMSHHSPNMAQIPAVRSPYGKECRDCWTVDNPYTHSIVGTDASGLELRCLAHLMNDATFTDILLTGDIHTHNMQMAGLTNRDQAKTFIYAFMYGAGASKIGQIVGAGAKEGQQLINKFLSSMPALKRVRDSVTKAANKGMIKGIDGRLLHIRSPHSALNTLIQGAGAVVCKVWLINMIKRIRRIGVDAKLVASIHDEYQFEVLNKDVKRFGQLTKDAMKDTEKQLHMKCPLDNEWKVGRTWAQTH
jgi:DNA polymerase I-like protein with 3'-5' exonuclease and polymerase domains